MSSKVEVNGKLYRPSFNHAGEGVNGKTTQIVAISQLCESVRNICEDMDRTLRSIDSILRRIDRRLAVDHKLRRRAKGGSR